MIVIQIVFNLFVRYAEQSFIPGQFLDELTQYKLADFTKAPLLYDVITDPTERFCIGINNCLL